MVKVLLIVAGTILLFLCFTGPDGLVSRRH
jgi:hypothetical protein